MLPRWILSFSWSWTPVFVFQGLWSDFKNTMLPILVTKPNLGPVTHTDHLICLLRNLCAGQEATVITGHGTTDCFQIWKGIIKAEYCQLAYLTICRIHHETCWATWSTAGIKIAGRNINHFGCADDTTLMAVSEEELKRLLMKVKDESENVGLKLNIQKTKIMASSPITLWQIDGKQWKQWNTLFGGAPKLLQMVTAAMKLKDTCSLEEKLWLI